MYILGGYTHEEGVLADRTRKCRFWSDTRTPEGLLEVHGELEGGVFFIRNDAMPLGRTEEGGVPLILEGVLGTHDSELGDELIAAWVLGEPGADDGNCCEGVSFVYLVLVETKVRTASCARTLPQYEGSIWQAVIISEVNESGDSGA